jgi:hypothetical protein
MIIKSTIPFHESLSRIGGRVKGEVMQKEDGARHKKPRLSAGSIFSGSDYFLNGFSGLGFGFQWFSYRYCSWLRLGLGFCWSFCWIWI